MIFGRWDYFSPMENTLKVHDKEFKLYITAEKIQQQIFSMGEKINQRFANTDPLFLAILNGSFMFASDLMKQVCIPSEISFVKLASYQGTQSTGQVKTLVGLDINIQNRTVIILEDIVDTGKTLSEFLPVLKGFQPKEILIASLLFKPAALKHDIKVDYSCFEVPNDFLVGYGLDYDGHGRNLPSIYQLVQ